MRVMTPQTWFDHIHVGKLVFSIGLRQRRILFAVEECARRGVLAIERMVGGFGVPCEHDIDPTIASSRQLLMVS